jgi:hypothetical protein
MNTQTELKETVTTQEIELNVEELEEVIAPGISRNHNETAEVELSIEELEEVIAPGITRNHNETVEVELSVEELEEVIAPGGGVPGYPRS